VLVTSCSCLMPENWTGRSHPPKSMVFAPYASYSGYRGVVFNSLMIPLLYFNVGLLKISIKIEISHLNEISVLQPESCTYTVKSPVRFKVYACFLGGLHDVNTLQSCVPQKSFYLRDSQ